VNQGRIETPGHCSRG